MSRWKDLDYVLKQITAKMTDGGLSARERLWYSDLHNRLISHEVDVEDAIWEAQQIGIRNPAFPDDLVGWLDDDFFDEDDKDEQDKE